MTHPDDDTTRPAADVAAPHDGAGADEIDSVVADDSADLQVFDPASPEPVATTGAGEAAAFPADDGALDEDDDGVVLCLTDDTWDGNAADDQDDEDEDQADDDKADAELADPAAAVSHDVAANDADDDDEEELVELVAEADLLGADRLIDEPAVRTVAESSTGAVAPAAPAAAALAAAAEALASDHRVAESISDVALADVAAEVAPAAGPTAEPEPLLNADIRATFIRLDKIFADAPPEPVGSAVEPAPAAQPAFASALAPAADDDAAYQTHFFDDGPADAGAVDAFRLFAARGGAGPAAAPALSDDGAADAVPTAPPLADVAVDRSHASRFSDAGLLAGDDADAAAQADDAALDDDLAASESDEADAIAAEALSEGDASDQPGGYEPLFDDDGDGAATADVLESATAAASFADPAARRSALAPAAIAPKPRAPAEPPPGYEFDVRPGYDVDAALAPDPAAYGPANGADDGGEYASAHAGDDAVDSSTATDEGDGDDDDGPEPAGSGGAAWTIPALCAGIGLIACCLLIPLADGNRRLSYERQRLQQDLSSVQAQVAVNDEFLRRVHDDPTLAERLAQRQMKTVREGTRVLALPGYAAGADGGSMSPFQLVTVEPPPPMPPYRPVGGTIANLCYAPRSRLYLMGAGLMLMAAGLVLGATGVRSRQG